MDELTTAAPSVQGAQGVQATVIPAAPAIPIPVVEVTVRTEQRVIVTTEDRLELWRMHFGHRMGRRDEWIGPLGLVLGFISILAGPQSAHLGMSKEAWFSTYLTGLLMSSMWLAVTVWRSIRAVGPEHLLNWLKRQP